MDAWVIFLAAYPLSNGSICRSIFSYNKHAYIDLLCETERQWRIEAFLSIQSLVLETDYIKEQKLYDK